MNQPIKPLPTIGEIRKLWPSVLQTCQELGRRWRYINDACAMAHLIMPAAENRLEKIDARLKVLEEIHARELAAARHQSEKAVPGQPEDHRPGGEGGDSDAELRRRPDPDDRTTLIETPEVDVSTGEPTTCPQSESDQSEDDPVCGGSCSGECHDRTAEVQPNVSQPEECEAPGRSDST